MMSLGAFAHHIQFNHRSDISRFKLTTIAKDNESFTITAETITTKQSIQTRLPFETILASKDLLSSIKHTLTLLETLAALAGEPKRGFQ